MFEVTLKNGETYKVEFQGATNVPCEVPTKDGSPGREVNRDGLYAHVLLLNEEETKKNNGMKVYDQCFSAFALLHPEPSQRSCRNIGRKVALTRALEYSGWDKETRTQFWDRYFEVRGKVN